MSDDPFAVNTQNATRELKISDSAIAHLNKLLSAEKDDKMMFRITVSGGGCSGFQYGFSFDDTVTPDDLVFERNGVKVVTDEASMDLLAGSEIDYVNELVGAYFKVNNPNASSSCGCGTSFAV